MRHELSLLTRHSQSAQILQQHLSQLSRWMPHWSHQLEVPDTVEDESVLPLLRYSYSNHTFVPNASTFCLHSSRASSKMSTITTARAPSFAKDRAIAKPNPRAPPVMKATPGVFGPLLYATSFGDCSTEPMLKSDIEINPTGYISFCFLTYFASIRSCFEIGDLQICSMILLAADVFRRVPKLESLPRTFAHYSPVRNNYIEMMLYHEKGLGPRDASPSITYHCITQ